MQALSYKILLANISKLRFKTNFFSFYLQSLKLA
jgi:hypothetical protein